MPYKTRLNGGEGIEIGTAQGVIRIRIDARCHVEVSAPADMPITNLARVSKKDLRKKPANFGNR